MTTNADAIIRKSNAAYKRGMSEYSGGSRGGPVAAPSLNNFKLKMTDNQVRNSVDSAMHAFGGAHDNNASGLSQNRKQ